MESVGILEQIQSLVSDKLQVVSYKWLSRNFLVSSNDAKRLLQDFVDNYGAGLEVVYSVSGWLKNNASTYHIRLVSQPKLSEAKEDFDGKCSVQVYSVQACLPKDPAVLWNAEYIQAEELFKQPVGVDNCLRDNRFCGVSNAFVKRNAVGSNTTPLVKSSGVVGQSKKSPMQHNPAVPPVHQKVVQQSSTNTSLHTLSVDKDSKSDHQLKEKQEPSVRPSVKTEGVHQLPINQRKLQNDKNSTGSAGALANMWGRASAKPKVECASAKSNNLLFKSADAQVSAHEETDDRNSNDDDDDDDDVGEGVSNKPGSNGEVKRKRRVVFDYSDEENELDDAVNLSSPDPPKKQLVQGSTHSSNFSDLEKINLKFEDENVNEPTDKAVKKAEAKTKQILKEEKECLALSKSNDTKTSTLEKNVNNNSAVDKNVIDKVTETAPKSPKRRKVLKTRIDERGREVTEVVWEGEEPEAKPDSNTTKKVDSNVVNTAANRPSGVKKSPALGANAPVNQTGKAANKKAGNKDPKQGNILSFFKKKV